MPQFADAAAGIAEFETYFEQFVRARASQNPAYAHIAYHFGFEAPPGVRRGKRLRPRLVFAAARANGIETLERAFPAATAVELLHNYSLIHDDIEDGDQLRHGRETLWSKFGLPNGVNAGDLVGALAQLAVRGTADIVGPAAAYGMATELAVANATMCEGQALDLALEAQTDTTLAQYIEMIEGKTAAVFGCAAALGARSANVDDPAVDRCRQIGRLFGLGFQIQDDQNGIWADTNTTGKTEGNDVARRKKTYPVVWAMNSKHASAGELHELYARRADDRADGEQDARVRELLDQSGALAAAAAAAESYFNQALAAARGLDPLEQYIRDWSGRRIPTE